MKRLILAVFVAVLSVQAFGDVCEDTRVKKIVKDAKKIANLILKSNEEIAFVDVKCIDGKITYINELKNTKDIDFSKFDEADISKFKESRRKLLRSHFCNKMVILPSIVNEFIEIGSFNASELYRVQAGISDCYGCGSDFIKQTITRANLQTPLVLDDILSVEKVGCEDDNLAYFYSLKDSDKVKWSKVTPSEIADFNKEQTLILTEEYCSDPDMTLLRTKVNGAIAFYALQDGTKITTSKVTNSDCKRYKQDSKE